MNGQRSFEQAEDPRVLRGHAESAHARRAADEEDLNHYSRGDEANETSRFLAAYTQLDLGYARKVKRRVIGEPFRALAPVYGADPAVITRWALSALRREFWRNALLFAGWATFVPVLWIGWPWQTRIPAFAIILPIFVISVVTAEQFLIQHVLVTRMLRNVFNPEDAPKPGTRKTRDMLAAAADPDDRNLVVFHEDSPFVGSGRPEYHWNLALDVSHGTRLGDSTRRDPAGFASAELHAEIIDALSHMELRDARVGERLFVNGRYIQDNPKLLPGWKPASRPPARVKDRILRQAARHPTPDARVYICAEMPGWEGQLVTTLFVRAVHAGGSLYIEWSFHVLPPLSKLLPDIDKLYSEPAALQLVTAFGRGLLRAVPYFLLAPLAMAWHGWYKARIKVRHYVQAWKIGHDQVFDYGAERSIREDASGFARPGHFIEQDQVMAIMLAQEALLQAVRNFLVRHDVDLAEFEGEVQVITYSTQKRYNAGSVVSGIVVGDMSAMTDAGTAKVPPGRAA